MLYYAIPGLKGVIRPIELSRSGRVKYAREIIEAVSNFYEVDINLVRSKKRHAYIIRVCQISSYIIRGKMPNIDYVTIASLFGNRYILKNGIDYDHSAIMYNIKKTNQFIETDSSVKDDIAILKKII